MQTEEPPHTLHKEVVEPNESVPTEAASSSESGTETHEHFETPNLGNFEEDNQNSYEKSALSGNSSSDSEDDSHKDNGRLTGVTEEGKRFVLPATRNPLATYPLREWGFFDWAKNLSTLHLLLLFFALPRWVFVILFLFWRAAYNGGLGWLLHRQSHDRLMTRIVAEISPNNPIYAVIRLFCSSGMGPDYSFEGTPAAFNAWLGFRHIVDVILANDLMCYFTFCFAYWELPESLTVSVVLSYAFGLFLCGFTVWAKTDAYRVVKDFAWYWGDFFFLVDQKLTFDRVFSISPHPMYTIGYGFYYGCSLLTQSSTVLYVSLVAHFMQLAFLSLVENPHIERTYPDMVDDPDNIKVKQRALSGYFAKRDLVVVKNFFHLRSADVFTLIIVAYSIVLNLQDLSVSTYVAQAIIWRLILNAGLGYVLHMQGQRGWFTQQFLLRGETKQQAFDSWKSIYNLCMVMAHVTVFCCFLKVTTFSIDFFGHLFFRHAAALLLLLINLYSSVSTYEVLGEFGWFYGDFFIDEVPSTLYYTGIYRFLNDPDSVTGFAGYYGLALISDSWPMYALALLSQVSHIVFVNYVERPHMKKLYGHKVRKDSGIRTAINSIVSEAFQQSPPLKSIHKSVSEVNIKLKAEAEKVRQQVKQRVSPALEGAKEIKIKAVGAAEELQRKMARRRRSIENDD